MPKVPDLNELFELIERKRYAEFRSRVSLMPSVDIAELFDVMPSEYYVIFYRLLPKETAAEAFVEMSAELKEHLINSFTDTELSATLEELYIDDTVDMIEEMPATVVKRILRNSKNENRSAINRLLRYPKNTAGAIMTTEYVRFTKEMTVESALSHIRAVAIDKETVYTCYVTDKKRHLIGIVTAKELLTAKLNTRLEEFMEKNVIFVSTTEDKEEVANKFDKYGFLALPVVDSELRLVGIITFDDAIGVMREEAEEDFAKMAAITPSETTYLKTGVFSIFKSRIPWLLLLMASATFSSAILGRFESMLPAVLLLFVPMLMDTGGNCGAQASVTVIRAISLNEAKISDFARILRKEICVGLTCGAALGVVAFAKLILIDRLLMRNGEVTLNVSLAVSLAVFVTVLAAKFIGSMLPLLAKRVGLDPAVMASPFITTLVDAVSLLLYFFISAQLLPI
ncbi:MAG: magnesium transporter [Ruminococcaceae bacterium]|nr:magnesium transporter [Oscillospiraceae bacterium]